MVLTRSLVFLALVLASLLLLAPLTPFLLLPRRIVLAFSLRVLRFWLFLLRHVAGLSLQVRGHEHLTGPGPRLVAAKHQSAFETLALQVILNDPAIVLKKELTLIPVAGWTMARLHHIAIDRRAGAGALVKLIRDAKARLAEGRDLVIFPEGTRSAPLAPPDYKPGVVALYRSLNVPCVPVALNSGVFWPRRSLRRFPGTVVIEFLPPLPPGLSAERFRRELEEAIEARSTQLTHEALDRA
jgi:1-acyl-sn-glycerol-3-phosphate acyltransferase